MANCYHFEVIKYNTSKLPSNSTYIIIIALLEKKKKIVIHSLQEHSVFSI